MNDASQREVEALRSDMKAALERISELEARLDMDHEFEMGADGELNRVEIPPASRSFSGDGIECRSETIKIQNDVIIKKMARISDLEKALESARKRLADFGQQDDRTEIQRGEAVVEPTESIIDHPYYRQSEKQAQEAHGSTEASPNDPPCDHLIAELAGLKKALLQIAFPQNSGLDDLAGNPTPWSSFVAYDAIGGRSEGGQRLDSYEDLAAANSARGEAK